MGTWTLDPLHTQVEFSAKHFGMMTVRGHFAELTATGDIHPEKPETSTVEVTIRTAREPFCPDGLVVLAEYRRRVLTPPSGG